MSLKSSLRKLVPSGAINWYHLAKAGLANFTYGSPGKKLKIYGITGTNGKTSTAIFLHSILEASGVKAGLATTALFSDGNKKYRNTKKMTTMSPGELNKLLAQIVENGATDAVVEVTSHALDQHRVHGINFDTVAFTNLSHDHLDYHKTKAAYQKAKEKLFAKPHRISIVNADDKLRNTFLAYKASRKIAFSTKETVAKRLGAEKPDFGLVYATDINPTSFGIDFVLNINKEAIKIYLKTPGFFNVSNALAAASAARGSNISLTDIKKGLEAVEVLPGRMESLNYGQKFKIYIDYAHTPDGLMKVFESIAPTVKGRLIHVGGATGNRDKSKRIILGALAGKFADIIIVTNEDPDNENPQDIIDQVASGVRRGAAHKRIEEDENFFKILDRSEAISFALSIAKANDVVLITGKGDETSMVIDGKLVAYSDREEIKKSLKALKKI